MSDKRKVTTDALETLGTIIESGGRDAIHLAVEPVIAAEDLYPGQHVGLGSDGATTNGVRKLGIVDPFILGMIPKGKMFWLVIYPRQITSLRHVWEHPDFPHDNQQNKSDSSLNEKEKSELWIRNYAASIELGYKTLMDGAYEYIADLKRGGYGEALCFGGLLEGISTDDDFWIHYEIITGEKVDENHKGNFFSCSC